MDRVKAWIARMRVTHPRLDHVVRTQEHYSATGAAQQAGAVTYFGFLSVFPILAVAFFVVGWVSRVYPDAQDTLVKAIDTVLPGLVGPGSGQVQLSQIQSAAGAVGIIGVIGLLYSGLGWVSALRTALVGVFEVPKAEQPSWLISQLQDLLTLVVLGLVLAVSVAMTQLLRVPYAGVVLSLVAGLATNMALMAILFLLARPPLTVRQIALGAVFGAVGFEVLKQLSRWLLSHTQGTPAFQVFGVSLILLVWINYFTRLTLYAASYALTARPGGPDLPAGPGVTRG